MGQAKRTVEPGHVRFVLKMIDAQWPDDALHQMSVLMACLGWMATDMSDDSFEELISHLKKTRQAFQQHEGTETVTIRKDGHD